MIFGENSFGRDLSMRCFLLLYVLMFILSSPPVEAGLRVQYDWKQIAEGAAYTTFPLGTEEEDGSVATTIHAFRIDPIKYRVDVALAKDEREGATAKHLAKRAKAVLAINGSFFTPQHATIGLIIKDGKEISPIHNTSWWSIFAMSGDSPSIYTPSEFLRARSVRIALQAGPRLVVNGKILKLKESVASRSAVGILPDGKIVIAITQGPGISMTELARRMSLPSSRGGFGCPSAMALDGGSSSQIYAKFKDFELSLPNIAQVTNGLVVLEKK